ncbi:Sporulation protein YunB [compost metagenome]
MILVEVYLRVKTELAVVVPFDMEPQSVETEIPVSYLLVVGDVPMYYYDSKGNPVGDKANAPNISIPALPNNNQQSETDLNSNPQQSNDQKEGENGSREH